MKHVKGTFTYEQGLNYGCAGQGHFDCQSPIAGAQLDDADKVSDSQTKYRHKGVSPC